MSTGTGDMVPISSSRRFGTLSRFPAWLLIILLIGAFVLYFFRFVREEQRDPHAYERLARGASRAE